MGRLVVHRFLLVTILIGMLYVSLAMVSEAVVKNPLFIAALFLLAVGFADVCWYSYRHPIRLRFDKEYSLSPPVGFYSHPCTKSGYFEISYKCGSNLDSMGLFDSPSRVLLKHALLERAPWVKDFGI